jgi:hypothetical protein
MTKIRKKAQPEVIPEVSFRGIFAKYLKAVYLTLAKVSRLWRGSFLNLQAGGTR